MFAGYCHVVEMTMKYCEVRFTATWFFEVFFHEENITFFAVISSERIFCFIAMKVVARALIH